ncbi:MAG: toprim domain-containing protein [bacterium]|nr:toprim domain-containing protein [bacterium]
MAALGIDVGDGRHGPCPVNDCGGKDRFRFDDQGDGLWFCNQCIPHAGDGFQLVQKVMGYDFPGALKTVSSVIGTCEVGAQLKENNITPEKLRKIFTDSKPILSCGEYCPGILYLKNRGLTDIPKALRYTEKAWETETKQEQRAILAVFSLPDGEAVTMHRIYVTADGKKLPIKSPKKMLPALKKMTGGAVRLYPWESGLLGIAEGIETAIAVHNMVEYPVWAALSTSLMEGFIPPKGVENIVIFSDNDQNYAGQKAAYTLANRLKIGQNSLKTVEVEIPALPGTDFLDLINNLDTSPKL